MDAFILLGDALWLDFVNSARGRVASPPDLLPDLDAFRRWCELQHIEPVDAPAIPAALAFRDRLTELAETLHEGGQPPGGVIAAINEQLSRVSGTRLLTRLGGEWRLDFIPSRPLGALEALARSAATTLAESRITVRRCAGDSCSLFFTDDSLNGNRHWCDPAICGRNANVERRRGLRR